ncbi:MAG: hypothetical protein AAGF11_55240 [Myxococcota bacterium]
MTPESQRDEESVDIPLRPPKEELPADVILRLLGEYSAKVSSGLRVPIKDLRTADNRNQSSRWSIVIIGCFAIMSLGAVTFISYDDVFDNTYTGLFFYAGTIFLIYRFFQLRTLERASRRGPELELAIWQLRRVYQVASRMEDLGRDVDFARQLELELRLSEAQFLLNRAEKLGITEATADAEIASVLHSRPKRTTDEVLVHGYLQNTD